MRLLAFVPPEQVQRLRSAAPDAVIHTVPDTPSLLELLDRSRWDLVVVDPGLAIEKNRAKLFRGLGDSLHPLLIYTSLNCISAAAVAGLSARRMAGIVVRDYDDSPELLHNALSHVPVELFGAQLVHRLGTNVDALPSSLRLATLATYCSCRMVRTAAHYAANSGLTRRSVDRRLQLAGLKPAKWIVSSAQFLRAYPLIATEALSLVAVSRMTGYGSPRTLNANARALTGKNLTYIRSLASSSEIVDLVENVLRL